MADNHDLPTDIYMKNATAPDSGTTRMHGMRVKMNSVLGRLDFVDKRWNDLGQPFFS